MTLNFLYSTMTFLTDAPLAQLDRALDFGSYRPPPVSSRLFSVFSRLDPDVLFARLDLAESVIIRAIRSGNLTAAIYYTKCHGRHRGWVERPKEPEKTEAEQMSPEEMARRIREAIRAADATVPAPVEVGDGKGGSPLN